MAKRNKPKPVIISPQAKDDISKQQSNLCIGGSACDARSHVNSPNQPMKTPLRPKEYDLLMWCGIIKKKNMEQ